MDGCHLMLLHHLEKFFKMKIKTFEDACLVVNENCYDEKFFEGQKSEIAYKKLKVIVQALNEGWEPEVEHIFKNNEEHFPFFTMCGRSFECVPLSIDSMENIGLHTF